MALAPLGARLVARLIDIAVVFGLNVIANGWFVWRYMQEVGPLLAEAGRRMLVRDPSTEGLPEPDPSTGNLLLTILLVAAAVWFAYEVPSIADHGQTLGKRVMRIKVVSLTDDPRLTFGRSLRRWNTLGLPVLLWSCGVGFVLQLIDCMLPLFDRPFRQALHDKQAQTVVVQVPATPVVPTQSPTDTATHIPGGSDDRP